LRKTAEDTERLGESLRHNIYGGEEDLILRVNSKTPKYGDTGENQMARKTAVLLPYFRPPRKAHELNRIVIKTILGRDLDTKYKNSDLNRFYGRYMFQLLEKGSIGDNWERTRWAAIVREKDCEIPDACYLALTNIYTKHWKHLLEIKGGISALDLDSTPLRYSLTIPLLNFFKKGVRLATDDRRFRIALQRWSSSYDRDDPLDSVLDCCSALEAIISCRDEIRLRISLSVYHILKTTKGRSMNTVYQMYKIRNDFIHGSKIPEITATQQRDFIYVVSRVLHACISRGKKPDKKQLDSQIIEKYSRGRE